MAYDLKEEKDVKQYLENLGVEYRFGCFSEKNAEACHLLADFLEAVKKNFEKAAKVYKTNCDDHNYAKSCAKYGRYTLIGRGTRQENPAEAFQYFSKACDHGDAEGCLHSGLMQINPQSFKDVTYSYSKGLDNLTKSCTSKNGNACHFLSGIYISGIQKGGIRITKPEDTKKKEYDVAPDMKKAFDYAKTACELNNMFACANLSQMYARGDGTEKNVDLAKKYKEQALEMQDEIKKKKPELKFQEGL